MLLPRREFDAVDLVKDWIGVVAAVALMSVFRICRTKVKENVKTDS